MSQHSDNSEPKDTKSLPLDEIERALAVMQPRQRLYKIVKAEMVKRGRWKNRVKE